MSIPGKIFKAPFINRETCWEQADLFRQKYWAGKGPPVDVLEIAEFDLDLEIRVIDSLKENSDVDALLLLNWKTIIVDRRQYMDDRFANRLRFSIAHELGHFVLHEAVVRSMPAGSLAEYQSFADQMTEREYSFLEFHANEFAGRLLVPLDELKKEFDALVSLAEQNGIRADKLEDDLMPLFAPPLAKKFQVSEEVIEKRLLREGLWQNRDKKGS